MGRIEGGTNTNVVPGKVSFKLDRRMIPEENPVEVEAAIAPHHHAGNSRACWPQCRDQTPAAGHAMTPLAGNQPLVDAIQKHAQAVIGEPSCPPWAHRCTPMCACMWSAAFPA